MASVHTVRPALLDLVQDVRSEITDIAGFGGTTSANRVGDLKYFGDCVISAHTPVNVLAAGNFTTPEALAQGWQLEYHQRQDQFILRNTNWGLRWIFHHAPENVYISKIPPEEDADIAKDSSICIPAVVNGERKFSLEEVRRALRYREFHKNVVCHASDSSVIAALKEGRFTQCGFTSTDVYNAQHLFGGCKGCLAGKMISSSSKTHRSRIDRSKLKPGNYQHCDMIFILGARGKKHSIYYSVDEMSRYNWGCEQPNRTQEGFRRSTEDLMKFYRQFGDTHRVKTIRCDPETGLKAAELDINAKGGALQITAPGRHVRLVEEHIGVLKRSMKAVLSGLNYELPRRFYIHLLFWTMEARNLVASSMTEQATSPYSALFGSDPSYSRHLRFGFGDLVVALNESAEVQSIDPSDMRTRLGIVVGRKFNTDGCIQVYPLQGISEGKRRNSDLRETWHSSQCVRVVVPDDAMLKQLAALAAADKEDISEKDCASILRGIHRETRQIVEIDEEIIANDSLEIPGNDGEEATERPPAKHTRKDTNSHPSRTPADERLGRKKVEAAARRYPMRKAKWKNLMLHALICCPSVTAPYKKALRGTQKSAAIKAACAEMRQLHDYKAIQPVHWRKLARKFIARILPSSLLITEKYDARGNHDKTKGRLAAGGHRQDKEIFGTHSSPTVNIITIFMLLAILAYNGRAWFLRSIDVKGAYLNARYEGKAGPVYMRLAREVAEAYVLEFPHLAEFIDENGEMIVRIDKALYGLVESGKLWFDTISKKLRSLGYTQLINDECVFMKTTSQGDIIYVALYVDDMLVIGSHLYLCSELERELRAAYGTITVQDGEDLSHLGMNVTRAPDGSVDCNMTGYTKKILEKYSDLVRDQTAETPSDDHLFADHGQGTPVDAKEYASLLMSLMFLSLRTRPDICKEIAFLSTHMQQPTSVDMDKLRRVLRYLNKYPARSIKFSPQEIVLRVWIDAAYAVHADTKSQSGIFLSIDDRGPVQVRSTKQKYMTTSSTWAELAAVGDSLATILWCRDLLAELGYPQEPTPIMQDNKSAITMGSDGAGATKQTKHIKVRYYHIKEQVEDNNIVFEYISTDRMVADVLTKALDKQTFEYHQQRIMNTCEDDRTQERPVKRVRFQ